MPLLDAKEFGAMIAQLRHEKHLSQDQVALAAGISRVQLQNIERGWSDRAKQSPANPRIATVIALCRVLDVSVRIDVSHPNGVHVQFEPSEH